MIFGTREKNYELGSFTSEACTSCNASDTYTFVRTVRYIVAFFINLIPIGWRFTCICKNCGNVVEIDKDAGRQITKTRFSSQNADVVFASVFRVVLLAAILAAAVVLPLLLIEPGQPSPEELASLVTEDGAYIIFNADGDELAHITMTGDEKRFKRYTTYQQLTGEPGAQGMMMMRNFVQAPGSTEEDILIEPDLKDAGNLLDKHDISVRRYYYDFVKESYGYNRGIEDLTTISYSDGKAVYPSNIYFSDDQTIHYIACAYFEETQLVETFFMPATMDEPTLQIAYINVSLFDSKGRVVERSQYANFNDGSSDLVGSISQDSTIKEVMQFIEQNELAPTQIEATTYYENTGVPASISVSQPDQSGMMQTNTITYNIEKSGRYYIVSENVTQ